jgi:Protein of unknown function (DUF4232)
MTSFHCDLRRMTAAAALGGAALLLTACGSSVSPAAAGAPTKTVTVPASQPASSAPATPATSASPTPAGPPPCPTSALKSALGTGNGAAGSTYYPLEFTNVSGSACTLFGYPGVSFATGPGGSLIGRPATRNPAVASTLITIPAGSTAHATLQVTDALNYPRSRCHMVTAHWLKIYPPNQTAPLYLSFTTPACAKPAHVLGIQAVQSGNGGG